MAELIYTSLEEIEKVCLIQSSVGAPALLYNDNHHFMMDVYSYT